MSKLALNRTNTGDLAQVVTALQTRMHDRGSELANPAVTDLVLSMESFDDMSDKGRLLGEFTVSTHKMLKDLFAERGIGIEGYTDAQWEAGAVILAAAGKAGAYARAAMTMSPVSGGNGVAVIDSMSQGMDYRGESALPVASMEAFDDRELVAHIPFSAVFNIQAARQDAFGEAFYQTVVVTPDQAGIEIICRRTMVLNTTRHENTGKPTDFGRQNLTNAVIDYKVLEPEYTLAVPIWVSGNTENNAKFTATSDITPYTRTVAGEVVTTSALKPGVELNLLGLSQSAAQISQGQLDNTDSLDLRVVLEALYIKVHATAGSGSSSILKFDTDRMPLTQFQKAQEGADRNMVLNFNTVDLPITSLTKDMNGATATALAYLSDPTRENWVLRLALDVNGRCNLELGTTKVTGTAISVDSVWDKQTDGSYIQVTDGSTLAALAAAIDTYTLIGYDLLASKSNLTRRARGNLVSVFEVSERHTIPLGTPITCPSPVTATRTAADLAAPIQATRIRNSNLAVTKLLKYAVTLSTLNLSSMRSSQKVPDIEGLGRLVVWPFYEEIELDLLEVTASVKSQDRALDVAAAIINQIRDVSYRMYRDSGYQPALDSQTGGTNERPTLVIGTDTYTHRHLIVPGDTRIGSVGFETSIVTSSDMRVYGNIYLTFTRPNQPGPDVLSFGYMAWMPELATNLQVTRNNSTVIETMVQPRTLHVNTLPILAVIKLVNLDVAIAEQLPIHNKVVV